jgi:hypothetical protein
VIRGDSFRHDCSGRVLERRHEVDQARVSAANASLRSSSRTPSPPTGTELRRAPRRGKNIDGSQVSGFLKNHGVSRLNIKGRYQANRLLGAMRHQNLLGG